MEPRDSDPAQVYFRSEGESESDAARLVQALVIRCLERLEGGGDEDLDEVCREHPELTAAVRERLHALREMGLLSEREDALLEHDVPARIGAFRILGRLGAGGMGVVFEAEQETPRRRVALKVVRSTLVSPRTLRRFTHEAQLLGMLRHPGIAQIYEAGTATLAGQTIPYFAMELVQGAPLDVHADQQGRDVRSLARCLASVCDAVHHAHQRGVIHRDLKPSNILVTASGLPKILDFGLACVRDPDLQVTSMHTRSGQILGTLPYMSPEQARGDDVDLRTDVYSLGVIAYQVLAGRLPLPLADLPVVQAVKRVQEQDPVRLGAHRAELRGDLETIVATALQKDPERRYPSAQHLGADLCHYLADEPIEARPPSTLYQVRKFVRRHRLLVAALSLVIVALSAATTISTLALRKALDAGEAAERARVAAVEQRQRAEQQAHVKGEVVTLLGQMLAAPDPWDQPESFARETLAVDLLDRAAGAFQQRDLDPDVDRELQQILGKTYLSLGFADKARAPLEQVAALLDADTPAAERLDVLSSLAALRYHQGRHTEAQEILERCVAERRSSPLLSYRLTRDLNDLGLALQAMGRTTEAERCYREALGAAAQEENAETPPHVVWNNLGTLLLDEGRVDEAAELLDRAYQERLRLYGAEHPRSMVTLNALSIVWQRSGDLERAIEAQRQVIVFMERAVGEQHESVLKSMINRANMLQELRQPDTAREILDRVVKRASGRADLDGQRLRAESSLAGLELATGQLSACEERSRRLIEETGELLGPDSEAGLSAHITLSASLLFQRRLDEAEEAIATTRELCDRMHPPQHLLHLQVRRFELLCLRAQGDGEEGVEVGEELQDDLAAAFPPGHWMQQSAAIELAHCYHLIGDSERARAVLSEALAVAVEVHGPESPAAGQVRRELDGMR